MIGGELLFAPSGDCLSFYGWGVSGPNLWELATGKSRKAKQIGHRGSIACEAFAPDGATLATGSDDGSIILWSVPDLDRRGQLPTHSADVTSLAFSPDGRTLVAGDRDGLVRLWEVDSGAELATLEGHVGRIVRVCFSPDGRTLATCGEPAEGRFEIFLWAATPRD